MALQEEPLYDFPEPIQSSQKKFLGHQRGRGSLRSISVLDRLLLTVPVWLQLSINPATALHILQREPPGTFLVRKSRTSQTNVLCVRLADDSVPSFVQQFGIREEHPTLSLETSAISFPDLPRLISFYCVSRDVLPFPLELPEAIAKATSHKELESISHMGIEFWNSHLNVRGPRSAPKSNSDEEKKPGGDGSAPPAAPALPAAPPELPPDANTQAAPESEGQESDQNPTLFHEFCPITTRSPLELDCGSGQGALCFINPLFLQSQNVLSRRRLCKRSLKVRVSTETSTLLSPPLAPPPPPPLLPKAKSLKRGAAKPNHEEDLSGQFLAVDITGGPQVPVRDQAGDESLQTIPEFLPNESDYMDPTSIISQPSLSPYLPPPLPAKASLD
ncbi:ras and Rab interactor 1-like [Neosynchiropus ocellatus]